MSTASTIQKVETTRSEPETTHGGRYYVPQVDIIETDTELQLVADVPGCNAEAIDVNFEKGVLSIYGRVAPRDTPPGARLLLHEYGVGDFARTFQIGEGIDSERIAATVASGVLTLHLPKTPAARSRKVTVKPA